MVEDYIQKLGEDMKAAQLKYKKYLERTSERCYRYTYF